MYLFKNYALKDWAAFNEIFGMPLRLGKYEASATPADREALRTAIISLGSDAAGIISKSTEIEFVEASARLTGVSNPYQVMAFFCNREMSKAVLGQTLTTDTEGTTGTYAAGSVQNEVRRDLLEADARAQAETLRLQLLRPLVGFNFGWDKPVPGLSFLISDSPDLKADAEVIERLVKAGLAVPAAHCYEHFGIPEPKGGEAVLGQAAPEGRAGAAHKMILPLRDGGLELLPQDAQVIRAQETLEELTQAALAASGAAVRKMLAPVRELLAAGASLEEIRDGLLEVYPDMEVAELAELIHQAGMLAWMQGRLEE
jgi:phage gp29-like protein